MTDARTFKKGEVVLVHDGSRSRNSVELATVGADCSYIENTVLISHGMFNMGASKASVHKLPPTLKKALNQPKGSNERSRT